MKAVSRLLVDRFLDETGLLESLGHFVTEVLARDRRLGSRRAFLAADSCRIVLVQEVLVRLLLRRQGRRGRRGRSAAENRDLNLSGQMRRHPSLKKLLLLPRGEVGLHTRVSDLLDFLLIVVAARLLLLANSLRVLLHPLAPRRQNFRHAPLASRRVDDLLLL